MNAEPPFASDDVAEKFVAFGDATLPHLLALRALIFETAEATAGVGPLTETLKWGEPSYLTEKPRTGTTVRIGAPSEDRVAVYVHCQTSLVADFLPVFADRFEIEGSRAIHFPVAEPLPVQDLREFLRAALTYHVRKSARPKKA